MRRKTKSKVEETPQRVLRIYLSPSVGKRRPLQRKKKEEMSPLSEERNIFSLRCVFESLINGCSEVSVHRTVGRRGFVYAAALLHILQHYLLK